MLEKVLIVDDSKISRKINRKVIESLKYEVVAEAIDGQDGMEKFKEFNPDIILTDLEMPNLNGIEMIKEIRNGNLNSNVKIIVISSLVNSQVIQEVFKYNVSIIKKPIKEDKLLNAIKLLNNY